MNLQSYKNPHTSLKAFNAMLDRVSDGPVYFELDSARTNVEIFKRHEKLFNWHYKDSIRSFTNANIENLTPYEFSYANRFTKHFGMDQLKRVKDDHSKILITWDPKVDLYKSPKPCLLLLKFFEENNKLHLQCVFRNRDMIRRLIPNWLCLLNLLQSVAIQKGKKFGNLYDYSLWSYAKQFDLDKWLKGG